jgi:hypothetical protein
MPRNKAEDPDVCEVRRWVRYLLAGFDLPRDPWAIEGGRLLSSADARGFHAVLVQIVGRATSLNIGPGSGLRDHTVRWALDRQAEGIVRALTKNPTPLDGNVFAKLFEWPGWFPGGAVKYYLWYAPMKTLRSIDPWLHDVTASAGVAVHDRSFLLRALGRLDAPAAVSIARDLLVQSPWATSEVLGMFGGAPELELMRRTLPVVASNEEARTRRHFEAGIRKLERRLARIDGA